MSQFSDRKTVSEPVMENDNLSQDDLKAYLNNYQAFKPGQSQEDVRKIYNQWAEHGQYDEVSVIIIIIIFYWC